MTNTNPEKWIEEFDEKWKRVWLHDGNKPVETYTSCEEELKSFIRLKLAEAEARAFEEGYRRTFNSKARDIMNNMRERSKAKGFKFEINFDDLFKWLLDNGYPSLFENWEKRDFNMKFTPTVDRIDFKKGYFFENMQLTTLSANCKKGNRETMKMQPILQLKDGKEIQTFESLFEASIVTGIPFRAISMVCRGKRNKTRGYEWKYLESARLSINKE